MSSPDPTTSNPPTATAHPAVVPERALVTCPEPTSPTRTARACAWLGFHIFELAGVTVPTLLAVLVSVWFAIPAVVVAVLWGVHEYRMTHGGEGR